MVSKTMIVSSILALPVHKHKEEVMEEHTFTVKLPFRVREELQGGAIHHLMGDRIFAINEQQLKQICEIVRDCEHNDIITYEAIQRPNDLLKVIYSTVPNDNYCHVNLEGLECNS